MDKIKSILSPGSSKDDEVLYGDENSRRAAAAQSSSQQNTEQLHPVSGAQKEPGLMRQILNPGGDKYDPTAHGTTATTAQPEEGHLRTDPHEKDHTTSQQILNPGSDKYDERKFSSAGQTPDVGVAPTAQLEANDPQEKKHEHGILRQIFNPGGAKYDQEGYGNTAHVVGDSSSNRQQSAPTHGQTATAIPGMTMSRMKKEDETGGSTSPASDLSIKSGVEGPFARANTEVTGSGQGLPDRTKDTTGDSHLGRDAAIAGTGVAGGAAAYEHHHHNKHQEPTEASGASQPAGTTHSHHHHHQTDAAPITSSQNTPGNTSSSYATSDPTRQTGNDSHLGRDAGIAGASAVGGTGAYEAARQEARKHKDHDEFGRPAQAHTDQSNVGSSTGPSSTSNTFGGSNTTDPTRQSGHDSHLGRDAAIAGTGVAGGTAAYEAHKHHKDHANDSRQPTSSNISSAPSQTSTSGITSQSQPNREAAILGASVPGNSNREAAVIGGTGLTGGAAAHEHGKHHHNTPHAEKSGYSQPSTLGSQTGQTGYSQAPSTASQSAAHPGQSHLGRDAAIVGGTGLAGGAAAHELGKHRDNAATAGQPGYSQSGSTGSYTGQTGLSQPSSTTSQSASHPGQSHLGRDAAIVGGTGLAGGAATHELGKHHGNSAEQTGLAQSDHNQGDSGIMDRPHPLAGGSVHDGTATTTLFGGSGGETERGIHQPGQESHLGRDAAYAGAGALGAGAVGSQLNRSHGESTHAPGSAGLASGSNTTTGPSGLASGSNTTTGPSGLASGSNTTTGSTGLSSGSNTAYGSSIAPYEGYIHQTHGPHPTDVGNQLDPHVPGEFPADDGVDSHGYASPGASGGGALTGGAAAAGGRGDYLASGPSGRESTQTSTRPRSAIGTFPGDDGVDSHGYASPSVASGGGTLSGGAASAGGSSDYLASGPSGRESTQKSTEQSSAKDHHYGRDAALAGGVGAAGVGAYEATKGRGDTGPASKTIGPHDSNLANVVDPRVQPDASKMKDHTTTGPHQSDTLNKIDPKVQSDPAKATEQDHHHGREAATAAGAAGAGGAAVYGGEKLADDHHDKHHNKLQKARKEEAEKGGDHGEKKPSLLHRILHPGEHKKENEHQHATSSSHGSESAHHPASTATSGAGTGVGAVGSGSASQNVDSQGRVIEPHTGLPMNVAQYGSGVGGTDGAKNIEGYHETDPAVRNATVGTAQGAGTRQGAHAGEQGVAGPDWEAIRKSNTPY